MRLIAVCVAILAIANCSAPPAPSAADRYERWLAAGHVAQSAAYSRQLRQHGLDGVVPMRQLLRSGRRWRRCAVDEFALPPPAAWPSMRPTLVLVRDLSRAGVLVKPQVASGFRTAAFNRCEGGSSRSRHLTNNALDFDLGREVSVADLCRYWRKHGAARRFGLGFYGRRQIHVDTSGFRTWGHDYTRASSLCVTSSAGTGKPTNGG
ncbi:D-Ala-D-Ala carboxypeptidase family metallohydrolase [Montanilutibacter psychrotolerans]|uniref:D-Ala-D-Ala carboxypeptidase family metallohydrolase n=1 Tax=Montanilutibacter psychrotolerans TaxID=1327343 RepID=UPI0016809928|nr:D-Ala-D-Ala carboxypeptidase family metallohydrolase [Lysobacter psychrotolerans]